MRKSLLFLPVPHVRRDGFDHVATGPNLPPDLLKDLIGQIARGDRDSARPDRDRRDPVVPALDDEAARLDVADERFKLAFLGRR